VSGQRYTAILRISEDKTSVQTLIIFDGQLRGECVPVAEDYCTEALALGKKISIVLRNVPGIDDGGLNMLRRFVRRGVRLHGTGLYASHMVKTLQQAVDA
jgi:hypothetical protein